MVMISIGLFNWNLVCHSSSDQKWLNFCWAQFEGIKKINKFSITSLENRGRFDGIIWKPRIIHGLELIYNILFHMIAIDLCCQLAKKNDTVGTWLLIQLCCYVFLQRTWDDDIGDVFLNHFSSVASFKVKNLLKIIWLISHKIVVDWSKFRFHIFYHTIIGNYNVCKKLIEL